MAVAMLGALLLAGCAARYVQPALPVEQLATVTLDSRAQIVEVDGLPYSMSKTHDGQGHFFVLAGCRALTAKYQDSYFVSGVKKVGLFGGKGRGIDGWQWIGNTEVHDYRTEAPTRFFVPAKAGYSYWVTASFTGDEFQPRVVEIGPDGEAKAKFAPDQPCIGSWK